LVCTLQLEARHVGADQAVLTTRRQTRQILQLGVLIILLMVIARMKVYLPFKDIPLWVKHSRILDEMFITRSVIGEMRRSGHGDGK